MCGRRIVSARSRELILSDPLKFFSRSADSSCCCSREIVGQHTSPEVGRTGRGSHDDATSNTAEYPPGSTLYRKRSVMSTAARKARKREGIPFVKAQKVGTPFVERAWFNGLVTGFNGRHLASAPRPRSEAKRLRALRDRGIAEPRASRVPFAEKVMGMFASEGKLR